MPDSKTKPMSEKEIRADLKEKGYPEIVQILPLTAGLDDIELTDVQKKVLAVKLYSGAELLSTTEKIALAETSRRSWYLAHHDQRFKDACVALTKAKIAADCPEIYERYKNQALFGNSDQARRQERLLVEANILKPNNTVINQTVNIKIEEIKKKRIESQRLGFKAYNLLMPEHSEN